MSVQSRADLPSARRVVVKVGSSSVSGANIAQIDPIIEALAERHGAGTQIVLVSSGAIASGLPFLKLDERPSDLATQQAAAAVGQNALMVRYQHSLERFNIVAAQVLLTAGDILDETSKQNAQRALERLLELQVLPIINENDTVATQEIRFGDNDRLAALVAGMVDADALILLSDVDALYTLPPHEPGAKRVPEVQFGERLDGLEIGSVGSSVGSGGAKTKVAAARLAAQHGIPVLFTSTPNIAQAFAGEPVGTWFHSNPVPAH